MQTLLLLTIVGSLAAGGELIPSAVVAQSASQTTPATKSANQSANQSAATSKSTTGKTAQGKSAQTKSAQAKSAQATHPSGSTAGSTAGSTPSRTTTGVRGAGKQAASAAGAKTKATLAGGTVRDSADGVIAGPLAPNGTISLRSAPDGQAIASIGPQSSLEPVAHDRGWVRVRTEGWVRETEVAATDSSQTTISAADLRTNPDGVRGKTVRWDVEVLAFATADPLRKGLNPDEPYLLARGPGNESALLYIAVPPSLLALARTVASRAPVPVSIVATVRTGRSEPVGVPILDAQSLVKR